MRRMRNGLALAFVLLCLGIMGCAGPGAGNAAAPEAVPVAEDADMGEGPAEYVLQHGDSLDIKFFYYPDLNESVTVRPDGRISLQLIGEVDAAGLAPAELDRVLTEKYSKVLRYKEVAVIVKEFAAQRVYVGGEVNLPGSIRVSGRLTSLQAIIQAGGFKDTAELRNVVILRNAGTGKPKFMTVNLEDGLAAGGQNDVFLRSYDVVFVPKTTIAKMNQFVDQYIDKLIPISRSFGFNYVYNLKPEIQVK